MNADIAAAADKVVNDRAVMDLVPTRSMRLADHDLRDVVCLSVGNHVVGNSTVPSGNSDLFAAQRLRQP
jgi:hypothetical protein